MARPRLHACNPRVFAASSPAAMRRACCDPASPTNSSGLMQACTRGCTDARKSVASFASRGVCPLPMSQLAAQAHMCAACRCLRECARRVLPRLRAHTSGKAVQLQRLSTWWPGCLSCCMHFGKWCHITCWSTWRMRSLALVRSHLAYISEKIEALGGAMGGAGKLCAWRLACSSEVCVVTPRT